MRTLFLFQIPAILLMSVSCLLFLSCDAPSPPPQSEKSQDVVLAQQATDPAPVAGTVTAQEASSPENNPQALHIVGSYPLPEEAFTGRLVLYFNQTLHQPGPGDEVRLKPFSFYPRLEGIYTWGENHISFQSLGDLSNNRAIYQVKIHSDLQSTALTSVAPPSDAMQFATYTFNAQSVELVEEDEEKYKFKLLFNVNTTEEVIKNALKITDSLGQPIIPTAFEVRGTVCNIELPKANLPIRFYLPAGIPDKTGLVKTQSDFRAAFPNETPLKVNKASWTHERYYDQLRLAFNDPVQPELLEDKIKILDSETEETFTLYAQDSGELNEVTFRIEADLNHLPVLKLQIPVGIYNKNMQSLPSPYETTLEAEFDQLQINSAYWMQGSVDGAAIRVYLNYDIDPESFQEHLSFEPAVSNVKVEPSSYQGLVVKGDFEAETDYTMTVAPGVKNMSGNAMNEKPLYYTLKNAPKSSAARFAYGDKVYFPKRVSGKMKVEARNVEKVNVTLNKIFPNNIPLAIQPHDEYQAINSKWSKSVGKLELSVPEGNADTVQELGIDLTEMVSKEGNGVYTVWLSPGSNDQNNYQVVVWTNLGVLSHWSNDEVLIFVHDLYTLEPVPQAKVTVYSDKNQPLGNVYTDEQGMAKISPYEGSLGTPATAVIEAADDYTFIALEQKNDDVPFSDSMPHYDTKSYDAFLYADRDLYRPGEMIHLRAIVRNADGSAASNVPLQIKLINPNDQTTQEEVLHLGELGTGGLDLQTQPAYLTGKYTVQIKTPDNDFPITSIPLYVEEFVPNRMKVEVNLEQESLGNAEKTRVMVKAEHLFGATAENRTAEAFVVLQEGVWESTKFNGFHFDHDDPYASQTIHLGQAQTNALGIAQFESVIRPEKNPGKPIKATVRGQVQEMGGRPVLASKSVPFFADDTLLGIAVQPGPDQKNLDVKIVAIDTKEQLSPLASVQVTLERQSWSYYVRRFDSHNESRWTQRYVPIQTLDLALTNGQGEISLTLPQEYGYFRVRVHSPETTMYSTRTFYRTWRAIQEVEDASPSMLKLHMSQSVYNIGDEAVLQIESPFDGQAYVVIQGATFHETLRTPIIESKGEVRFTLTENHSPNIWAEVTVVHAVKDGTANVYPYSSFGATNIVVKNPRKSLQVAIVNPPESIRPETDLALNITTQDHNGTPVSAEVTVAVVDEGIHLILGYINPDPLGWFMRSRRPFYNRAHYYDKVAYDFEYPQIGGDVLERRLGKDTPTIDENWIKPLALWSGAVMTDDNGSAMVKFEMPKFNGEVRVVAVAANAQASGSAATHIKVKQPYMLRLSLPRFALPRDMFKVNTLLFNTTTSAVQAKIAWQGSGTLSGNTGSRQIDIPANQEQAFYAEFIAQDNIGQGSISWSTTILDVNGKIIETMEEETPLPVREPAAYQSHQELIVLQPGESRSIQNTLFVEDERLSSEIIVSANPLTRLKESLDYVIGYPYGCIEQTTSRTALLYLLRRSEALREITGGNLQLDSQIQSGIDRLFSMQLSSGALSFWPGRNNHSAYGTVYACHLLTQVFNDQHYEIGEQSFRRLQHAVRDIANNSSLDNQNDLYTRAYALYVLALDGDLQAIQDIERFDSIALPRSARYLLAAALAMNTQDLERAQQYLHRVKSEPYHERLQYGNFNSAPRNTAVELIALLAMQADEKEIHANAEKLLRYMDVGEVKSTQDKAFVVTALSQYFNYLGGDLSQCNVVITSPQGESTIQGSDVYKQKNEGAGVAYTVNNIGSHAAFVHFSTAGIPKNPRTEPVEAGIKIERSYKDDTGEVLDGNKFMHGQAYLVNLSLELDAKVDNLIIADMLPAGLEISNPRLDDNALEGYDIYGGLEASHLEVRDDRLVVAFDHLEKGIHNFYYLVRAITPGKFQQPAVHAECMYDPGTRGSSVWRNIEVQAQQK